MKLQFWKALSLFTVTFMQNNFLCVHALFLTNVVCFALQIDNRWFVISSTLLSYLGVQEVKNNIAKVKHCAAII